MGKKSARNRKNKETLIVNNNVDIDILNVIDQIESSDITDQIDIQNDDQAESLDNFIRNSLFNLYENNSSVKMKNLENLHETFQKSFINVDIDCDWKDTMIDKLSKLIHHGNSTEPVMALKVFTTFITQIGDIFISDQFCKEINESFQSLYLHKSISPQVRQAALRLISLTYFLSSQINWSEVQTSMNHIWNIFKCTMQRDRNIDRNTNFDVEITAMKCWTLLFSILPSHILVDVGLPVLSTLTKILKCSNVDSRITAGESIALIYNKIRTETDHEFHTEDHVDLIYEIELLATDGKKSRNKQDRKIQRLSFREILKQVQIGERDFQVKEIRFHNETMEIDDWMKKCQYEFLCDILEDGITHHLQRNIHVRYIFNMGRPIEINESQILNFRNTQKKSQNLSNKVNAKLKKQERQQNRSDHRNENMFWDD